MGIRNKRGQGLSTNAIVLIVLGIIVLVILILGFTIGWNRFLPFVSSNNLENVQTACSTACATNNVYNWCTLPIEVNDGITDKFADTCYNLTIKTEYASMNYGIDSCPGITCAQ